MSWLQITKAVHTDKYSKQLQSGKVTALYKGRDHNDLTNYHPVCMLPMFSKELQKWTHSHLTNFVEKHSVLFSSQFSFCKNKLTELALLAQKDLAQPFGNNARLHWVSSLVTIKQRFSNGGSWATRTLKIFVWGGSERVEIFRHLKSVDSGLEPILFCSRADQ